MRAFHSLVALFAIVAVACGADAVRPIPVDAPVTTTARCGTRPPSRFWV